MCKSLLCLFQCELPTAHLSDEELSKHVYSKPPEVTMYVIPGVEREKEGKKRGRKGGRRVRERRG